MSKPVRISQPLYDRIEALAREEARSVANMVAVLLEQALAVDGEPRTKVIPHDFGGEAQITTTLRAERSHDKHFKPDFKEKGK